MAHELLDVLDEAIQDLDEAGFMDQAETLYQLAYETTWASDGLMLKEVGVEIMRIESRLGGELPQSATSSLTRCMEVIRRAYPNLSLTED